MALQASSSSQRPAFVSPFFACRARAWGTGNVQRSPQRPWVLRTGRARVQMSQPSQDMSDREPDETVALGERLVRAAMMSDKSAVVDALEAGASPGYVSATGGSSMTALMWAASEGNAEVAAALIASGLTVRDVNVENSGGYTAIVYAFENMPSLNPRPAPPPGFPGAVEKKEAPPQVPISVKVTGHSGCAKLLLMKGADLSKKNNYDESLLHLAARKGQLDWIDLLLTQGLDVNARNRGYQHTALTVAAMENHENCIRRLCEEPGVDINARNVVGWTPLMWASANGNVNAVKALLDFNADPNIDGEGTPSSDGARTRTTPLKESRKCEEGREIARLLIRAGAIE